MITLHLVVDDGRYTKFKTFFLQILRDRKISTRLSEDLFSSVIGSDDPTNL